MSTIIVVCLGDSTTAGTPLFKSPIEAPPDGEGDEQSQFAYWLRQAHPDWRVLNRGVNGERSDEIAARFDRDVLAHAPHVVVIIAGVNDVYQGRDAAHVTAQLRRDVRPRARGSGIAVVAGTIVPYNTATPDQNARMRAIKRWIGERSRPRSREACWFVDTRARGGRGRRSRSHSPDRPTACIRTSTGYRRMAEALEPAIAGARPGNT